SLWTGRSPQQRGLLPDCESDWGRVANVVVTNVHRPWESAMVDLPTSASRCQDRFEFGQRQEAGAIVRTLKYLVELVVMAAVITGAPFSPCRSVPAASGASAPPITFSSYYLDMGAWESLGVQPTGILGHNGAMTDVGYANDLVRRESLNGVA